MAQILWLFYVSKPVEFIDTVNVHASSNNNLVHYGFEKEQSSNFLPSRLSPRYHFLHLVGCCLLWTRR